MGKTSIEWATRVWNPVTGCTPISEGCQNCYARRMATRLAGRCGYPAEHPFAVTLHGDRLDEPLRWKRPQRVFVCSMGDLFHDDVPSAHIRQVFNTIGLSAMHVQHTYLILTKRPARMKACIDDLIAERDFFPDNWWGPGEATPYFPSVWLGVTAENQARADERIPLLLQTPAAKHFVSCEPLLGPIDLGHAIPCGYYCDSSVGHVDHQFWSQAGTGIDWVIAGGETGPGARPMHPRWARSLRDQCQQAGIPFFFKQWGEWSADFFPDLSFAHRGMTFLDRATVYRVGKQRAGDLLDGRQWHEIPEVLS